MSTAPTRLSHSRATITPALRAAVDRLDHRSRHQAAYHFGWITAGGAPTNGDAGKAVRPALALLSAEAVGASPQVALPGAVAVELVHNFSLVHDDLMDGDEERRHKRTVWKLWGSSSAILTGDAMLTLAQEVLLDAGTPTAVPAALLLARTTRHLIRGQVQDLSFERRPYVTVDECLDMAADKTGALLSASSAIGAVLAGAPAATVDALARYGDEVGRAFQLTDDVLGIWGDPAVTGKPVHSDLRARKKSLPVSYALQQGGTLGVELGTWLSAPGEPGEEELRRAAELIDGAGGREWALAEAARRMKLAEDALLGVDLDAGAREELLALGRFVVDRDG
ncbi:dimethylallyltranstransferase [Streptomyces qinglanensis]|uniref:Dimethylallyltranstransferase n=1 Tax=Streptomyces qinglanensis TaxID=943816 RepID=A0A1E7K3C1_9ACTN|nr:polyprenyl synthetase family protein [Streptomyces qinglanensis]OEU98346.1 dimethylallyltranstransferase [Streptomyces qinglanensis]OEV23862.1 dimethylallyltranstransferase [Streptomyces nanshensis]